MRLILLLALAPLLQSQILVEGTVVNRATHKGIPAVSVTLDRGTEGLAYRATTDSSGAFKIPNVDPGDYLPIFEKHGLSVLDAPSKPVHIAASLKLHAEMISWTRISGRVFDTADHPIPRVRVTLIPLRAGRGSTTGTVATTADDGAFTLAMQPGLYRLLADPYETDGLTRGALSAPVPPESRAWAPTYYPAATDPQSAQTIAVSPALDLSGYDVRLQSVPLFHIHGTVLDTRGTPVSGIALKLVPPPANWWEPEETEVTSGDAGAFDFPHARPGDWRVVAELERGESSLMGFAEAQVKTADVTRVTVRLAEPFTLTGTVEGAKTRNADDLCESTSVSLISTEIAREATGEAQENGALSIPEVYPGRYKVQVCGVSSGHYLASVLLSGHDVLGQEFALSPGAGPIRVVFKSDGGAVRGTVAEGAASTVVLVPADESLLDSLFVATTQPGEAGHFELTNVRPGTYHAYAFDHIPDPDALTDPTFLKSVSAWSTTVTVAAAQSATLDLKVTHWPE